MLGEERIEQQGTLIGMNELLNNTPIPHQVLFTAGTKVVILDKSTLNELGKHVDLSVPV